MGKGLWRPVSVLLAGAVLSTVGINEAVSAAAGASTPQGEVGSNGKTKPPPPTVSSFTASPSFLSSAGGPVTLSADVTNATRCRLSSNNNRAISGLPAVVACSDGTVDNDITVRGNPGKKAMTYKFSLFVAGRRTVTTELLVGAGRVDCSDIGSDGGPYIRPGADLQGCNFNRADFSGDNLTNANLSGANLTGLDAGLVNFTGANLTDADLTNATLAGANLTGANLTGADLDGVTSGGITGTPSALPANWTVVDGYLVGPYANLTGANLDYTDFTGADLTGLDAELVNFTGANLTDTDLTNANLAGANLAGANLSSATLTGVSGGGIGGTPYALPANFELVSEYLIGPGADLHGAALCNANLANADLDNANLAQALLQNADLQNANLADADLFDALLPEADLYNANLTAANLDATDLVNANLTGANLFETNLANIYWYSTTCPDGTNSENDGGTCANNLVIPDAPTNVSAMPGDGQATVSWGAPDNDVAADVTSYTVTASDVTAPGTDGDGTTCTGTDPTDTCTVTGLTDGDSYTFTVTAFNENGVPGPTSTPSSAVMPTP